ncbi:CRISPR-associated helicase Cas3' [Candidatus Poribacteria bacterium]|nr:MAG: CRISPR-associated helicase Cas3' [Candidatus Poribacteria bacterium]
MQTALTTYQQFAGEDFTPNPMQEELFTRITTEGDNPALLLKAPTGSGKTEAVLIPSLDSERRLFFIFPTRSLVDDQIKRCEEYLQRASEKNRRSYALVVDRGSEVSRTVFHNGEESKEGKRHLYDGDIILTTFDKFLYRFFGFGEPNKSYIFPFRIHHSKKQNLFCFDEVHAYDQVAFVNFQRLVKALYKANLDMVVMTATMPDTYQNELHFLDTVDYIDDNKLKLESWQKQKQERDNPNKTIKHIAAKTEKEVTDKIQDCVSEQYEADKRIIVTIETIKDLVPVYKDMKAQDDSENIFLYHGRLSNHQRKKVYKKLKKLEDTDKGYLLYTTSAIEVGCDLDAHLLITELCNPDSLIQRAGRCNRKGKIEGAEIVIVGNKIPSFLSILSEEKTEKYLEKLKQQSGDYFNPSDILGLMEYEPHSDYRAEVLFDMLYEYVYQARLENKPLHDKGLVITRSFAPSLTLTTKIPDTESSKQYPENAVSVSISSCIAWKDKDRNESVNQKFKVFHRFYDERDKKFKFVRLNRGGSIYFKELFVEVPECYFSEELGYVEPPKVFEDRGTRGYRRNFVYHTTEEGKPKEIWLYYLKDFEKPQPEDEIQLPPAETADAGPQEPEKSFETPPESGEQLNLFEID